MKTTNLNEMLEQFKKTLPLKKAKLELWKEEWENRSYAILSRCNSIPVVRLKRNDELLYILNFNIEKNMILAQEIDLQISVPRYENIDEWLKEPISLKNDNDKSFIEDCYKDVATESKIAEEIIKQLEENILYIEESIKKIEEELGAKR